MQALLVFPEVSLSEINEACSKIQEVAHEDANIIFGAVIDENLQDEIRVTVIATGFPATSTKDTTKQATNIKNEYARQTNNSISYKESLKTSSNQFAKINSKIHGATAAQHHKNGSDIFSQNFMHQIANIDNKDILKISPIYEAQDLTKLTMGAYPQNDTTGSLQQDVHIQTNNTQTVKNDLNNTNILFDFEDEIHNDYDDNNIAFNINNVNVESKNDTLINADQSLDRDEHIRVNKDLDIINSFTNYDFDIPERVDNIQTEQTQTKTGMLLTTQDDKGLNNNVEALIDTNNTDLEQQINEVLELAEKIKQGAADESLNTLKSTVEEQASDTPAFLRVDEIKTISLD